jgi:hypothetical protein
MVTQPRKLSLYALLTILAGASIGCASGTVQPELAPSHPAHPQATEAVYRPLPNPFQGGPSMTDHQEGTEVESAAPAVHHGKTSGDQEKSPMLPAMDDHGAGSSGMDHSKPEHGGHSQ